MTPFQLDASAKAPCTSTIVGLAPVCWSVAFTGNLPHVEPQAHVEPQSTVAPGAMRSRPRATLAGPWSVRLQPSPPAPSVLGTRLATCSDDFRGSPPSHGTGRLG